MIRLQFSIDLDYDVHERSRFILQTFAARTQRQRVVTEQLVIKPDLTHQQFLDPMTGTRACRLVAPPGSLHVHYEGTVEIEHYFAHPNEIAETPVEELPLAVLPYLRPSRYCQSDRLQSAAFWEFAHMTPGYARVDAIRRWVHKRTKFAVGTSDISTSALDTLVEQCGVCRDFVHLMIAYCRALSIPARFVTSLDYGADSALGPPDFHSFVEVFLGGRWYMFDPTGITPLRGLLRIATGRDAADVAFATMFGQVKGNMPRVYVDAVTDPQQGWEPAAHTGMAVSTADEEHA